MNKNKEKNLTRRKDGLLEKKISTPVGRKSIYGYSEKELAEKKKELLQTIKLQGCVPKATRFSDYMEKWLSEVKKNSVRRKTYDRNECTFRCHIKNSCVGRSQIGNLCCDDIQKLINEKSEKYSKSTVSKIKNLIGECLRYALVKKDIGINPMEAIVMPHEENYAVQQKEIVTLSEEDVEKFYKSALSINDKTGQLQYKYGPAYILLLNTGLRAGELMALKKKSISFDLEEAEIIKTTGYVKEDDSKSEMKTKRIENKPKTKNGIRNVPLNNIALQVVQLLIDMDKSKHIECEYLIHTSNNKPVTHSNFQRGLDCVLRNANLSHTGLHSLRHTFATLLIGNEYNKNEKVDIKAVSQILGHANVGITLRIYYHPEQKKKHKAVDILNNIKCPSVVKVS